MVGIQTLLIYILAVSATCIEADEGTNETTTTVKPEGRILGGEFATPDEFPHQIQVVQRISGTNNGNVCGGTLIREEWVLTAAHCVTDKPGATGLSAFTLTAGRYFGPSNNRRDLGEQTKTAQKIFIHECYLGDKVDPLINNDVALIKVSTPFTLNDKVKIIQLDEDNRAKNGTQTTAIGWGRTNPIQMDIAPALKKATLFLPADDKFCEESIEHIDIKSQICVNGTDAVCSGDSGGPLLCNDGGVNYLCGIASLADTRCISGGFNVFVRVFHFRNWIKEVMGNERNSKRDCVTPKFTLSTGGRSLYRHNLLPGLYIGTILISFLFTW